jgi:Protein of unknown function (DUF4019)
MTMPILAALLLATTPPSPEMRSEKLGDGEYRIILVAPGLTLAEGQMKALQEAARLCGGYPVSLGHYRWRSNERLGDAAAPPAPVSLTLEQEARCAVAPPPPVASAAATAGGPANPAEITAVLDLTRRYFEARTSARYTEAWALLTQSMQEMSPLEEWRARAIEFNRQAGAGPSLTPVKVTWYDNPPNAPVAGTFVAVDFLGESKALEAICGYVVWLRQPDGSWRLTREEQGVITRDQARGSTPEQRAQLRTAMGCRDPG